MAGLEVTMAVFKITLLWMPTLDAKRKGIM
jgi:hypothetical protein